MKHVLCINGPPRSGKDTAAQPLTIFPGADILRFSDPLKRAVPALFGLTHEELEEHKDEPQMALMGLSYRQWQISLSEEWLKPKFGKRVFGALLASTIRQGVFADLIVVPDSGFQDELDALRDGLPEAEFRIGLLRLQRLGCDYTNDSRGPVFAVPGVDSLGHINNNGGFHVFCSQVRKTTLRWINS